MFRTGGGGRINERDVPESQHTVFIRGLPGNMSTDDIREFFEKDYGSCTFDFVKVSPDRTKLYVAVRFDSKISAREVMERFSSEGEMLGYKVELTWFRDIRRYLAHCAKQGIRPSRFRGRDDYRGDRGGYRGGRVRSRSQSPLRDRSRSASNSRSRSYSRSHSRSLSRSQNFEASDESLHDASTHSRNRHSRKNARHSHKRSPTRSPDRTGGGARSRSASAGSRDTRGDVANDRRSRSRSRSAGSRSQSRSKSASSAGGDVANNASPRSERERSLDYSDIVVKKERPSPPKEHSPSPPPAKRSKREKRRKEKRRERRNKYSRSPAREQQSASDMEMGEEEEENKMKQTHQKQQEASKIFIGPVQPIPQQPQQQQQQQIAPPPLPNFYQRHLPPGAVAAAATAPPPMNNEAMMMMMMNRQPPPPQTQTFHQQQSPPKQQQIPKVELRNQSIKLDLSDPKNIAMPKFKPIGESSTLDFSDTPANQAEQQQQYSQFNGSKVDERAQHSPPPPVLRNVPVANSTTNSSVNIFTSTPVQEPVLPLNNFMEIQRAILQDIRYKPYEEEEEDHMGQLRLSSLSRKTLTEEKRDEKLSKFTPEMRERVNKKKRQLELSYRSDCETYGLVVNKLIAKDRSLEERLKVALLETMKDLEGETMKQLDEFVDQLSFLCST